MFDAEGVAVREPFTRRDESGVPLEQVDGAIDVDGELYLVEAKWLATPMGVEHVNPHISRLFVRGDARGLVLSASGYTSSAVAAARDALSVKTVILCELEELLRLFGTDTPLVQYLRYKIQAAVLNKQPLYKPEL
jgi:hypothetical protein